jgi:hypothetical protein
MRDWLRSWLSGTFFLEVSTSAFLVKLLVFNLWFLANSFLDFVSKRREQIEGEYSSE